MALFGKTADQIVDEAIQDLRQNTSIDRFTAGAKARGLVRVLGRMTGGMYSVFDFNQAIGFISGASGIYLDFLGELVGISRLRGRTAYVDSTEGNVRFYTTEANFGAINSGNPIEVNAGVVVSTRDQGGRIVRYRTVDRYVLPASQNSFYVSVEAVEPGILANVGSNSLVEHNFSGYAKVGDGTLFVTNDSPIDSGLAIESDEQYRFRISNSAFSAESANSTAVRLAILSVPSVLDVDIIEYKRGIGTSNALVTSITGFVTDDMVATAQAAADLVRAHGTDILVEGPVEVGLQAYITLRYRPGVQNAEKTAIEAAATRNLRSYILSLDIGDEFVINEAAQRVMETDERILDMGLPGAPFDAVFTFHPGIETTSRIRRRLLKNYVPDIDEKVVMEQSVDQAVVIRRV